MRSRGIVVVLALILAVLATVGVFLYSRGVKNDALEGGSLVTVVVARVDIPANTDLNALIRDDEFATLEVPEDAVVRDAITAGLAAPEPAEQRLHPGRRADPALPGAGRAGTGRCDRHPRRSPGDHAWRSDLPRAVGARGRRRRQRHDLRHVRGRRRSSTWTGTSRSKSRARVPRRPNGQPIETPKFDTTVVLVPEVEVLRVIRPQQASGRRQPIHLGRHAAGPCP